MARGQQVLRQWKILRALEASRQAGMTADALHDILDEPCSVRTVYRDLEQLQSVGFPILSEDGSWRLLETGAGSWRIPVEPTQVLAIMLSEDLLAPFDGSWLHDPIRELRSRLGAMLTPAGRAYCDELRGSAVATLASAGHLAEKSDIVDVIQDAVAKEHRLSVAYAKPGSAAITRKVDPYSTWFHNGRLYLVGWCHRAEDIRTFNIQRIADAALLDEPFDPDPTFDPAAFTRLGFGVFHGPVHHVVIDFEADVAHLVLEIEYHHSQRTRDLGGGRVRLVMDAAGLPEIAAWVTSFGGSAVPKQPPELIEAVRARHRAGLAALSSEDTTSDDTPTPEHGPHRPQGSH